MERTDRDIDEFIAGLPEDRRGDIRILHDLILSEMSDLAPTLYQGKLWGGSEQEIIGYGNYSYTRSDKQEVEWFQVGLALQKNYISLYINAVANRKYLAEVHGPDLGNVKVGKSSISFSTVDDIDLDRLRDLVVRARQLLSG